jgi:hypothetical protein
VAVALGLGWELERELVLVLEQGLEQELVLVLEQGLEQELVLVLEQGLGWELEQGLVPVRHNLPVSLWPLEP